MYRAQRSRCIYLHMYNCTCTPIFCSSQDKKFSFWILKPIFKFDISRVDVWVDGLSHSVQFSQITLAIHQVEHRFSYNDMCLSKKWCLIFSCVIFLGLCFDAKSACVTYVLVLLYSPIVCSFHWNSHVICFGIFCLGLRSTQCDVIVV